MAELEPLIDFDPTTEEGRTDINEEVDKDFDVLLQREGEENESWMSRFGKRFRGASEYAFKRFSAIYERKTGKAVPEYMEMSTKDSLDELRLHVLKAEFPNLDVRLVELSYDENRHQQISFYSKRKGDFMKPERLYKEDGTVRKSVVEKIKSGKYDNIESILNKIEADNNVKTENIRQRTQQIEELRENNETGQNNERIAEEERLNEEEQEQIEENEAIRENLEERMSLRERVKRIFKKYGFTATAVLTAVGVIIGVIVSQLSKGLTSVVKGVGNGLKTLGKKLGEILPGMIGAIASFIFKTAGEVVSFVAEHAWLLILAVVAFVFERMKKR